MREISQTNLVDHGFRLPSALDNRPLNIKEFEEKLIKSYTFLHPSKYELDKSGNEVIRQELDNRIN